MMFFYSMSSVFDNFIFTKTTLIYATLKCKKRSKILWKLLLKVGRYMYIIKFNEPWNYLHGFKKSRDGPLSTRVFDSFYKVTDSNPFLPNSEKTTVLMFRYQWGFFILKVCNDPFKITYSNGKSPNHHQNQ